MPPESASKEPSCLVSETKKRISKIAEVDKFYQENLSLLSPPLKEKIDEQVNLSFNKINKDFRILIETGTRLGDLLKSLDQEST